MFLDVGVNASIAEYKSRREHGRINASFLADGAEISILQFDFTHVDAWWLRRRRHGLLLGHARLICISIPPFKEVEEEDSHWKKIFGEVDDGANSANEAPKRPNDTGIACVDYSSKISALRLKLDVLHGEPSHSQSHQMQKWREIRCVVVQIEQLIDEMRSFISSVEARIQNANQSSHLRPHGTA